MKLATDSFIPASVDGNRRKDDVPVMQLWFRCTNYDSQLIDCVISGSHGDRRSLSRSLLGAGRKAHHCLTNAAASKDCPEHASNGRTLA